MEQGKPDKQSTKSPYLARWEIILLFITLIVSMLSLWMTLRAEKASSVPNIQIESVDGSRSHNIDRTEIKTRIEKVIINCMVVLKNAGRAPTQIVNVRWEPVTVGEPLKKTDQWLAISDEVNPNSPYTRDYFNEKKDNPVLGIRQPILLAGETKNLQIVFESNSLLSKGQDTPNVRLVFVFGNGQELTVLPEIKYSGVSTSFTMQN